MGVPARKMTAEPQRARTQRPALKAVTGRTGPSKRRNGSAADVQRTFRAFVVITAVVCLLGLGRVWLSVQAAEASLEAGELRGLIKTERYKGDMLEVQQSALSSPSRIRAIAGATMNMQSAGEVTYIDLEPTQARAPRSAAKDSSAFERTLTDVLSLAAGEAQVLLVGDVGLASAR